MNHNEIKGLIETAAGPDGQKDENWEAVGVDRLYFSDPRDPETSGAVDVQRSPDGAHVARVKLELWITPERAAEIVAIVTGAKPLALEALARRLQPEIARKAALPMVALGYVAPANDAEVQHEVRTHVTREHESDRVYEPTAVEKADEARRIELERLVKEQEEEERLEAEMERKQNEQDEPEELAL